ncbi:MAG: hypothetical protein NTZ98_09935 [Acidobacteria bacterium]|jgi:hypothetical protein|nr:hypothetical protein [Acidobacteriota bacterium]
MGNGQSAVLEREETAEGQPVRNKPGRRAAPDRSQQLRCIAAIFLAVVLWAQLTGHWKSRIPSEAYFDLIPRASQFSHP